MNLRKSLTGLLLVVAFVVAAVPSHASAHVLAEDNGISAVMHIPPYDAPEAGVPTKLEFEFGTDNGSFHLTDYTIKVAVSNNGKAIQTQPVAAAYFGDASEGTATVQFPGTAVYGIRLEGMPTSAGKPAFVMNYNVRVATAHGAASGAADHTANAGQTLYIGSAVLIVFGMFTARQLVSGGRYKTAQLQTNDKLAAARKKRK